MRQAKSSKAEQVSVSYTNKFPLTEPFSEKYLKKLDEEAVIALKSLNDYFGKKNAVTEIRNKVAFHYKDKDGLIEENFRSLPETEPWEFYLSKTHGNTFYYLCEMVATGSALSLAGKISEE